MTRAGQAADLAAEVVVVGGGIVGLAIAAAVDDAQLTVALVKTDRPGAASRAAAGLLVPHYGGEGAGGAAVERFMTAGRDLYPSYVRWATERSGIRIPFDSSGAIELARSAADREALFRSAPADAERLTADAVAALEPALAPTAGGVLYPRDGAVDNVRLTDALESIVLAQSRVRVVPEPARSLALARGAATVVTAAGVRVQGRHVVLAAGAWSAGIDGCPRRIRVRPVRGQICAVRGAPIGHVVLAPDVYAVSRGGDRTLVGSTMEEVGFDPGTTPEAVTALHRAAADICPALGSQPVIDAWGGLRPATPDLLPILGPDPEYPALVYACGHSRNGILLAPITAAVTRAILLGGTAPWDISPFSVERFDDQSVQSNRREPR